ncbi:tRNA pseudouridine32 synthase/23S rRNA pseudouridine746 synthase [Comamonas sp. 4034]
MTRAMNESVTPSPEDAALGPPHTWMRDGVSPSCVVLPSQGDGWLLDYLAERLPLVARQEWQARMQAGDVVDAQGQPLRADQRFVPGQRVYYWRAWAQETPIPFEAAILYEDERILLVDKPHFLPVLPTGKYVQNSLLVRLKRATGNAGLSPLHRIDRDTAGLVLLSKDAATRGAYQALFRDRAMHKSYEAVAPVRADLAFPREHHSRMEESQRFFLMHEVPGTPNSHTRMAIIESNGAWARYALEPISGKRHQLRVHMAALGIPIRNDAFYPEVNDPAEGDFSSPLQLLAKELAFTDPVSGQVHSFRSRLQLLELSK